MNDAKKYVARQPLRHSSIGYAVNDVIELNDDDAQFLVSAGYVRLATDGESESYVPLQPKVLGAHNVADAGNDALQVELDEKTETIRQLEHSVGAQTDLADNLRHRSELRLEFINQLIAERTSTHAVLYSKLTKDELNAELDKRGIEHDAKAKNDELMSLLTANDKAFEYVESFDTAVVNTQDENQNEEG